MVEGSLRSRYHNLSDLLYHIVHFMPISPMFPLICGISRAGQQMVPQSAAYFLEDCLQVAFKEMTSEDLNCNLKCRSYGD